MNDMSLVIVPKSDQMSADDLITGPRTITITEVDIRPGTEQPVTMRYEGDEGRPYKPCKSMSRVFVTGWGPDAKVYIGRSVTLYRDPKVKWGGMEVGGIRVSHMSHIAHDLVVALTETKGKKKIHMVKPLVIKQTAPEKAATPKRTIADLLVELQAELDNFKTEEEVNGLAAGEIVQKVLSTPGNGATKLNAMIKAALDRVALPIPTEDEGLPD